MLGALISPVSARTLGPIEEMSADLDGQPIDLVEVGQWYCHDFDFPLIHCYSDPSVLEEPVEGGLASRSASTKFDVAPDGVTVAAATVTYVTVYEHSTYQGAYMHMSQDYSMLSVIGWNDRISSFVAKTSPGGAFWTDWLYAGTRYSFCCYQAVGSLGTYNDTFSSVFHN